MLSRCPEEAFVVFLGCTDSSQGQRKCLDMATRRLDQRGTFCVSWTCSWFFSWLPMESVARSEGG